MKQLLAIAVIVFLPFALSAQTQHIKLVNDGAFAAVSSDSNPLSTFNVNVSRGTTNSGTNTNLNFFSASFAADFSSATFISIAGAIPDTAFTGDNTRNLSLNFDVSTLNPSTSFSQTCTADFTQVDPVFTCGPLTSGTIQLTFSENDIQRNRILAFQGESTFGTITVHTHQRSDNGSASVQGTIFGTSFSSANATVGVNHMSTLELIKN